MIKHKETEDIYCNRGSNCGSVLSYTRKKRKDTPIVNIARAKGQAVAVSVELDGISLFGR